MNRSLVLLSLGFLFVLSSVNSRADVEIPVLNIDVPQWIRDEIEINRNSGVERIRTTLRLPTSDGLSDQFSYTAHKYSQYQNWLRCQKVGESQSRSSLIRYSEKNLRQVKACIWGN